MRSNYKALGPYIGEVDIRDTDGKVNLLLGVSIQKKFMRSIANTIGTDMSTYKIVKRNQFAYGPVTSRNGDKISIALLEDYDEAIVSQAYVPFEVSKPNELLPEYLMMWFRRPEFDRYARYMSHGSAREIFSWEEMCNTMLPIPSITKQREIVAEYNAIQDRIKLNEQLIAKLEECAQVILTELLNRFEAISTKRTLSDYVESANTGLDAIKRAPIVERNTGTRCLRIQDVSRNACYDNWGFTEVTENNFKKFRLRKDDIIIARTGATVGGNLNIMKDLNAVFNNGLIRLRADKSKIHPAVLQAFCKSEYFKAHIEGIAFGTSTQPNIQIGDLLSYETSFPPIDKQTDFSNALTHIQQLSSNLNEQTNALDKVSKLIQSKLATISG